MHSAALQLLHICNGEEILRRSMKHVGYSHIGQDVYVSGCQGGGSRKDKEEGDKQMQKMRY